MFLLSFLTLKFSKFSKIPLHNKDKQIVKNQSGLELAMYLAMHRNDRFWYAFSFTQNYRRFFTKKNKFTK